MSVAQIGATLAREGFLTNGGAPWPARSDGRVVIRALLREGILPDCGADQRGAQYASDYAKWLEEERAQGRAPAAPMQAA